MTKPPLACQLLRRSGALLYLSSAIFLAGCGTGPVKEPETTQGRIVCDSYIILDMCVRDLTADGQVDMIYFTDTEEIFMYRTGMKEAVGGIMPFHQCAVPLSSQMQATTNRILLRGDLSLSEELGITKDLISSYMAAKPEIDACNAQHNKQKGVVDNTEEEFYVDEDEWED
ncbi:MAG: hypothetical protein V7746_21130 [Halioglobus sp.]